MASWTGPDDDKIAAICDMPTPQSYSELQRFLEWWRTCQGSFCIFPCHIFFHAHWSTSSTTAQECRLAVGSWARWGIQSSESHTPVNANTQVLWSSWECLDADQFVVEGLWSMSSPARSTNCFCIPSIDRMTEAKCHYSQIEKDSNFIFVSSSRGSISIPDHFLLNCFRLLVLDTVYSSGLAVFVGLL